MLFQSLLLSLLAITPTIATSPPITVAEESDYTKTASYAEVVSFIDDLEEHSAIMQRATLGSSFEGKELPLVILANPPIATAEEALANDKLRIFAFGNIHAGEVCGKEALLQLAHELGTDPDHAFFEKVIFIIAPIYNADGNDKFDTVEKNRPGQVGPERVGLRRNAQDRDLNRDYVKLETPEARSMVRFLNEWDPHLTIDCHTTNGSFHQYTLTYAAPQNPSGESRPIEFVRDELLPRVSERLRDKTGYETFFYGNFNRDHTQWLTYSPLPRFGAPYRGLRGQMSILSEAYSYAPFIDRVVATREFVREIMLYATQHDDEIKSIHENARLATIRKGSDPQPSDVIGLRHQYAAFPELVTIPGWEYESELGRGIRPIPTNTPKDYPVIHLGRFEPTLSVKRPLAYIIPPGYDHIIEKLKQHGIEVEAFNSTANVTQYKIAAMQVARTKFEGHRLRTLDVTSATQVFEAGDDQPTSIIFTAQPLGNLIVYLLEPQSEDGFAAWDMFGNELQEGVEYPILRVERKGDLE